MLPRLFVMLVISGLIVSHRANAAPLATEPTELVVTPTSVTLTGPRDVRQLIVTGKYADGSVRDLTGSVEVSGAGDVVSIGEGAFLRGRKNGTGMMTLKAGGKSVSVAVTVAKFDEPAPVSFRRDVVAAMNVGGCNMGACHGTPSGKNGFRLSLRGFDPILDFNQLTRDQFGRRTSTDPSVALLTLKGFGRVPHEGGARLSASSIPGEVLTAWQAEGMRNDSDTLSPVRSIEVLPGSRVLLNPANRQQLAVVATFEDGTTRDVTRLSCFSSSDPAIADVNLTGKVDFKRPGEVAILVRYLETLYPVRLTYLEPREGFVWPNPPETNFVDTHVFAKLKQMTILPSGVCTDGEFIRRAYLDSCGRLPSAAETQVFLADSDPKKRDKLIEKLVNLPEFAEFWALKWADVLRSSRKTIHAKGSYAFQHWLRDKFASGAGMDTVVRDLLTSSGNTYTNPPANYFRIAKDPQSLAEATAQLFLGVRMSCAKCHNHPFEKWTQDDYYGFASWFARVKTRPVPVAGGKPGAKVESADIVLLTREGEITHPRSGKVMKPRYPGLADVDVKPGTDRRTALADWITKPSNPFFAKNVANRVWFHLLGKGIVDPVDDFRDSNPSCNDELLDALATDFAKNGYELKKLVATIMKSRTYQLSATPNETNADDAKYFSHAVTRLLSAEQLLDALCDVTGVAEKFAGMPAGTRAIQLPDGEVNNTFMKTFGQPARELSCECERESDGNLAQALQLINGPTVNEKVRHASNRLAGLLSGKKTDREILDEIYLSALSRLPDTEEAKPALAHIAKASDRRKAWEDVLWAVINTREFLFRH